MKSFIKIKGMGEEREKRRETEKCGGGTRKGEEKVDRVSLFKETGYCLPAYRHDSGCRALCHLKGWNQVHLNANNLPFFIY